MNIFLTGQRHIGKSTIIKNILTSLNTNVDGFVTFFGPDRTVKDWSLYMAPAGSPPSCDAGRLLATLAGGINLDVHTDVFDGWGAKLLSLSGRPGAVTVMDELGFLERDASLFAEAVSRRLSLPYPVLGVFRAGLSHWAEILSQQPDTSIITVTMDNRDVLTELILQKLREVKYDK